MLVRRLRLAAGSEELSWTETAVLRRLGADGASTTADLARSAGMRPQSMRTIVASLEELGMVERKPHAMDGRQVNLALTPKGAEAQQRAGDAKQTWVEHSVAKLSVQEQQTLFEAGRILKRMIESERP